MNDGPLRRVAALVLFVLLLGAAPPSRAADLEALPPVPDAERIAVPGDAIQLAAYLFRPAAAAGPVPAVILLHGAENTPVHSLDIARRFASEGYAVLAPSQRGGQGSDFGPLSCEFKAGDVVAMLAWLGARADIDGDRLAVAGGGQGATVALLAGAKSDAVRAVVVWNAATDLERWIETNPHLETAIPYGCGKTGLARNSPVFAAAAMRAPVLLLHGAENAAVPPEQTRAMAAALDAAGKPHRTVFAPGAGNRFSDRDWRALWPHVASFLQEAFSNGR